MRDIKFQFLYKGLPHRAGSDKFCWHKKVYSLDQLMEKRIIELSDVHHICELIAKRQFTGLTDKNGVDIYEGDILSCYADDFEFAYNKVVEWDSNKCELGITTNGRSGVILSDRASDNYEVIGNIYQDPELLEK